MWLGPSIVSACLMLSLRQLLLRSSSSLRALKQQRISAADLTPWVTRSVPRCAPQPRPHRAMSPGACSTGPRASQRPGAGRPRPSPDCDGCCGRSPPVGRRCDGGDRPAASRPRWCNRASPTVVDGGFGAATQGRGGGRSSRRPAFGHRHRRHGDGECARHLQHRWRSAHRLDPSRSRRDR